MAIKANAKLTPRCRTDPRWSGSRPKALAPPSALRVFNSRYRPTQVTTNFSTWTVKVDRSKTTRPCALIRSPDSFVNMSSSLNVWMFPLSTNVSVPRPSNPLLVVIVLCSRMTTRPSNSWIQAVPVNVTVCTRPEHGFTSSNCTKIGTGVGALAAATMAKPLRDDRSATPNGCCVSSHPATARRESSRLMEIDVAGFMGHLEEMGPVTVALANTGREADNFEPGTASRGSQGRPEEQRGVKVAVAA